MLYFVSARGRQYTAEQVRAIVLARLGEAAAMTDAWLRRHNGEIPGALVRDLRLVAMGITSEGE